MGRTVGELETSMPVSELFEWMALNRIDYEDQQNSGG